MPQKPYDWYDHEPHLNEPADDDRLLSALVTIFGAVIVVATVAWLVYHATLRIMDVW